MDTNFLELAAARLSQGDFAPALLAACANEECLCPDTAAACEALFAPLAARLAAHPECCSEVTAEEGETFADLAARCGNPERLLRLLNAGRDDSAEPAAGETFRAARCEFAITLDIDAHTLRVLHAGRCAAEFPCVVGLDFPADCEAFTCRIKRVDSIHYDEAKVGSSVNPFPRHRLDCDAGICLHSVPEWDATLFAKSVGLAPAHAALVHAVTHSGQTICLARHEAMEGYTDQSASECASECTSECREEESCESASCEAPSGEEPEQSSELATDDANCSAECESQPCAVESCSSEECSEMCAESCETSESCEDSGLTPAARLSCETRETCAETEQLATAECSTSEAAGEIQTGTISALAPQAESEECAENQHTAAAEGVSAEQYDTVSNRPAARRVTAWLENYLAARAGKTVPAGAAASATSELTDAHASAAESPAPQTTAPVAAAPDERPAPAASQSPPLSTPAAAAPAPSPRSEEPTFWTAPNGWQIMNLVLSIAALVTLGYVVGRQTAPPQTVQAPPPTVQLYPSFHPGQPVSLPAQPGAPVSPANYAEAQRPQPVAPPQPVPSPIPPQLEAPPKADLKMDVYVPEGQVAVGDDAQYEIHLTNRGKLAAEAIDVQAFFSEGFEPVAAEGSLARINPGRVEFARIARLVPGQEIVLKISARSAGEGERIFRPEVKCANPEDFLHAEVATRFSFGPTAGNGGGNFRR